MLKYKLKENPIKSFSFSYIEDYLKNLGIEKTESFLTSPSPEDEESYKNLDNIEEAIDVLHEGFTEKKSFFLQIDSDADGYTSSAIFYAFFKKIYPDAKIDFRVHDGKEHGIILNTVPMTADIVVVPDAGSTNIEEQETLNNRGVKVVIIDHHKLDAYPTHLENVVIVNNQTSKNFKNKSLSGAGMVYKTIQAYCDKYLGGADYHRDYMDLAAVGITADMMDTRELDNHYLIHNGLKNIKNPMLMSLLQRQSYSISDSVFPNKIDIAFYIAPIINGVVRFGTEEEKIDLFMGFADYNIDKMITTVYRGNERVENYYDYVSRVSYNVKERQNRQKLKALDLINERIVGKKLNENQLVTVIASIDEVPQTITGLVAMEILKKYKKPALVLRPKIEEGVEMLYGSGRGKANGDFTSLFKFLERSDLCEFVAGHDMAHGVGLKRENLPDLIKYANEHLSHIEFDIEEVEVDYIFSSSAALNKQMLWEFAEHIDLYGNQIPQPKFVFKIIMAREENNWIGADKLTFRFFKDGISFIKFKDKELKENIDSLESDRYELTIVGRSQINEWNNNKSLQIIIDNYSVKEIKIDKLF